MSEPIRNFGLGQRLFEEVQAAATVGGWPARLVDRLGITPRVTLVRHTVTIDRPLGQARRIRIGFASDWHAGPTTSEATLEAATAALERACPDVILLGGDFVSLRARHARQLVPYLRRLAAAAPAFAVLGNHDYYAGAGPVLDQLALARVDPIGNASVTLAPPFERVSVVGLDDHSSGHPNAAAAFASAAPVRLLLMHQPSGLLDLGAERYDLAFAGHTHGGQIRLPGLPPLYLPSGRLSRRYAAGRFDADAGLLFVSRGVGCTLLPIRWNAPADVMVIELESTADQESAGTTRIDTISRGP